MEIWQPLQTAASPSLPLQSLSLTPNLILPYGDWRPLLLSQPPEMEEIIPCSLAVAFHLCEDQLHTSSQSSPLWDKHHFSPFLVARFLLASLCTGVCQQTRSVQLKKLGRWLVLKWNCPRETLMCYLAFTQKVVQLFTKHSVNTVFNRGNLCIMQPAFIDSCFK